VPSVACLGARRAQNGLSVTTDKNSAIYGISADNAHVAFGVGPATSTKKARKRKRKETLERAAEIVP
jgi:hypothetical protein